jgi:predicted O-methyltransferase YrrM
MRNPLFFREHNYDLSLIPVKPLRKLERSRDPEVARAKSGFSIGNPGWGLLYYLVKCQFQRGEPGVILETGTNKGATTSVLAQALLDTGVKNPRLLTFELQPDFVADARAFLAKCRLDKYVSIFEGNTRDTLPRTLEESVELGSLRFVLLDASHLHDDVKFEFESVLPYLSQDALVIMDNTYPIAESGEDGRVAKFLENLTDTYGGSLIELPFVSWYTPCLAIWQRSRPNWNQISSSSPS